MRTSGAESLELGEESEVSLCASKKDDRDVWEKGGSTTVRGLALPSLPARAQKLENGSRQPFPRKKASGGGGGRGGRLRKLCCWVFGGEKGLPGHSKASIQRKKRTRGKLTIP